MVITISVIPLFIYPSLLLCSYRVITVFYDLQIFLYPTNENVTCIHCAATPEIVTSSALMTFGVIHHRLEASNVEVTFGAIYLHVESPPSTSSTKNMKVYYKYHHKAKIHYGALNMVML
jgi:hypothetical protein